MGEPGWFEDQTAKAGRGFLTFAIGAPMLAAGFFLLMFSLQKSLAEIAATEREEAIEHVAERVGRGLRKAGAAGTPAVRLKCRSCGFLDSEDARFCSQCAAPM